MVQQKMISKELISVVLNEDISSVYDRGNYIQYGKDLNTTSINIYELAHKCKEWAFEQGVEIVTYKRAFKTYRALPKGLKGIQTPEITEDSEAEAVFKACEWILEKIKG